jgi:GTPase
MRRQFTPSFDAWSQLPIVAVVGRPNVGKSTLVNRLAGERQSIVDEQPGVTRDRSYHAVQWRGRSFWLVDTGGLTPKPTETEPFALLVNEQISLALNEATVVVFLLDGQTGMTEDDALVARQLRDLKKPLLVAVNKIDRAEMSGQTYDFYQLGLGDPMPLCALHGDAGVGNLLDAIAVALPKPEAIENTTVKETLRLALVGRPNVGKSSLLNALVGEGRCIVSDLAGTTRDAIDTPFSYKDQPFILVDTAGIRRKTKVDYGVEMFSVDRAIRALRRADVAVLVLDALEPLTDQDKRIAQKVIDAGRALVVVVNKWDTIEGKNANATKDFQTKLLLEMPNLGFASFVFTSATEGQRVLKILDLAIDAVDNSRRRLTTHVLNELIHEATDRTPPPTIKNKKLRILYATQVKAGPPTFVLFVNDPKLMKETYQRYIERRLREQVELTGTPVRFLLRGRKTDEAKR